MSHYVTRSGLYIFVGSILMLWHRIGNAYNPHRNREIIDRTHYLQTGGTSPAAFQWLHKNTERHTAHTIVSWPNPKQWVIMNAMASQITSLTIVYSTVYSVADQRKHQSPASLAFVRGIHRWPVHSPHKGPVTRKMLPFDDVIVTIKKTSWNGGAEAVLQNRHPVSTNEHVLISTPVCINFELRPGSGDIHICWFNCEALTQWNIFNFALRPGSIMRHMIFQDDMTLPINSCLKHMHMACST